MDAAPGETLLRIVDVAAIVVVVVVHVVVEAVEPVVGGFDYAVDWRG